MRCFASPRPPNRALPPAQTACLSTGESCAVGPRGPGRGSRHGLRHPLKISTLKSAQDYCNKHFSASVFPLYTPPSFGCFFFFNYSKQYEKKGIIKKKG